MQNVRANVKVMEFQFLYIFSCILTLLIILIKPLTTKAYDKRTSDDCGTSGFAYIIVGSPSEWDHRFHAGRHTGNRRDPRKGLQR